MKEVIQKLLNLLLIIAIVFFIVGCSSKTSTKHTESETELKPTPSFREIFKYTESEIQLIPPPSFRKIFIPSRLLKVKTNDMEMLLRVRRHYENNDYLIGQVEGQSNEIKIPICELKEVGIVKVEVPKRKVKTAKAKTRTKPKVSAGEVLAETLPLLPLIPFIVTAPIVIPMTKSMGAKSDKVNLIYKDMTKDELIKYVGEPKGKYRCIKSTFWSDELIEIWEYNKEQVLSGADLMLFRSGEQQVYYVKGKWNFIFYSNWKSDYNCQINNE